MNEQVKRPTDPEVDELYRKLQEVTFNRSVMEKVQSNEMIVETVDLNLWNKDEERMKKRKEKRHEKYKKVYEDVMIPYYYGDTYYLSNEELEKYPEIDKLFMKLSRRRMISKNVAEYIRTFRLSIKCLKAVADDNGVMPRDEFIEKYFAGDIDIFGLWAPEYDGRDKKFINWEVIDKYIADPEMDESIFDIKTSKHKKDIYDIDSMTPEEYEETGRRLWGDEWDEIKKEKEDIKNGVIDYKKYQNNYEIDPEFKSMDPVGKNTTKKIIKRLQRKFKVFKHIREFIVLKEEEYKDTHPLSTKKGQTSHVYRSATQVEEDAFRQIEEEDRRKGYKTGKGKKNKNEPPEFKGSFLKGRDYRKYQKKLEDWKDENTYVYYQGVNRKLKDAKDLDYWLYLESLGYNVRKIKLHIDEVDRNSIYSKMKRLTSSLKESKKKDKKAFEKARDYFIVEDEGKESQNRMQQALNKLKKGEDVDLETIDNLINAEKRRKYGRRIKVDDKEKKKKDKHKEKDKKLKKKKDLPMINTKKRKEKKPKLKNKREIEEGINRVIDDALDPYGTYAARNILEKKDEVVEITWDDIIAEYSE